MFREKFNKARKLLLNLKQTVLLLLHTQLHLSGHYDSIASGATAKGDL